VVREYVLLAEKNGQARNPSGLERHLLKSGLSELHLAQLITWKKKKKEEKQVQQAWEQVNQSAENADIFHDKYLKSKMENKSPFFMEATND
jgi:hypothetical protein